MVRYPYMLIDLDKIRRNTEIIVDLASKYDISVVGVVKGVMGDLHVTGAMISGGVSGLADANPRRLARIKRRFPDISTMFIRLPMLSEASYVVRHTDISINSEIDTIRALSRQARRIGKKHKKLLMVEVGDLREGMMPDEVVPIVKDIISLDGVEIYGIAANFACYSGLIPEERHFDMLNALRDEIEDIIGKEILLSGGNSANIDLLLSGKHPPIDELRIGEAILCGTESLERKKIPGTFQDAFRVYGEVIEVRKKPTTPGGRTAQSGFGEYKKFTDRGRRWRAIVAIGAEDIDPKALKPTMPGIEIEDAASDHMVIDIEDAEEDIKVGDVLEFVAHYNSIMRGMLSPYLRKVYAGGD